jgi:hypothetical protein
MNLKYGPITFEVLGTHVQGHYGELATSPYGPDSYMQYFGHLTNVRARSTVKVRNI